MKKEEAFISAVLVGLLSYCGLRANAIGKAMKHFPFDRKKTDMRCYMITCVLEVNLYNNVREQREIVFLYASNGIPTLDSNVGFAAQEALRIKDERSYISHSRPERITEVRDMGLLWIPPQTVTVNVR